MKADQSEGLQTSKGLETLTNKSEVYKANQSEENTNKTWSEESL